MSFTNPKGDTPEFLQVIKKIELIFLDMEGDDESIAAGVAEAIISLSDLRARMLSHLARGTIDGKRFKRTQRNNTSGSKGVTFNKSAGKWQAKIGAGNGRAKHLGYFETMDQAAAARAVAEAGMWGLRC
jgi:hypothetical protein